MHCSIVCKKKETWPVDYRIFNQSVTYPTKYEILDVVENSKQSWTESNEINKTYNLKYNEDFTQTCGKNLQKILHTEHEQLSLSSYGILNKVKGLIHEETLKRHWLQQE